MPVVMDDGHNPDGLELGYWPSYTTMIPCQRGYYIRWLASGRKTPPANVGYAFIYFYGLERRALLDKGNVGKSDIEIFEIMEEVKRLLQVCGASRSFRSYAERFLVYLHAKHLNDPRMTEKSLADLYRLLPASRENILSRLVLGYRALQNSPLSAEQAFNLLQRLPNTAKARSLSPSFSTSPKLLGLFARGYRRIYPQGFTLSASFGPSNSVSYTVASGTLSFPTGTKSPPPAVVPSVLGKASQFKKLQALYDTCIQELAGRNAPDELVVVRPGGERTPGEPLPLVPIDMSKVAALKEETEILTQELASVFTPEESDPPDPLDTKMNKNGNGNGNINTGLGLDLKLDLDFKMKAMGFPKEVLDELDSRYWPCLSALLKQRAWNKEDLSLLTRRYGLLPNALMEAVNTWSAETLGDFLFLEENGVWTLMEELLTKLEE
jgi:hypothetical protein